MIAFTKRSNVANEHVLKSIHSLLLRSKDVRRISLRIISLKLSLFSNSFLETARRFRAKSILLLEELSLDSTRLARDHFSLDFVHEALLSFLRNREKSMITIKLAIKSLESLRTFVEFSSMIDDFESVLECLTIRKVFESMTMRLSFVVDVKLDVDQLDVSRRATSIVVNEIKFLE